LSPVGATAKVLKVESSRTPEGPINFCPICGTHCRIEPSVLTHDAVCPRCGSILWFEKQERAVQLAEALSRLPEAQREALVLQHWQGWSLDEIAEQMGRTRTAVAGLLKRGLRQLRDELSG
jgi:hypothetical protein